MMGAQYVAMPYFLDLFEKNGILLWLVLDMNPSIGNSKPEEVIDPENIKSPGQEGISEHPTGNQEAVKPTPQDKPPSDSSSPGELK